MFQTIRESLAAWVRMVLVAALIQSAAQSALAQSDSSHVNETSASEVVAEMRAVWQARAERMGACRMEWIEASSCSALYALVSANNFERLNSLTPAELNQLMEPPLLESSLTYSLVLDGPRMRKERVGERVIDENGTLEAEHVIEAFDGQEFVLLDQSPLRDYPVAMIYGQAFATPSGISLESIPAFASIGLLYQTPNVFYDLEEWEIDDTTDDAASDLITLHRTTEVNHRYFCTFDRSRDFLLVQWESFDGDQPLINIDIEYSNETPATAEWVATNWTTTHQNGDGSINFILNAELTRLEVNTQTTSEEFSLDLPPASFGQDHRPMATGYDARRGYSMFVVKRDGSIRVLVGDERDGPVEEYFD